jgi:predicted nucleic-acid-binding Zn-ribbon protein
MSSCPKCNGSMSEGFIVDHGDYGAGHVATYQAGAPQKSFWTGLKQDKKAQFAITTFRCSRCGYLENYAKS